MTAAAEWANPGPGPCAYCDKPATCFGRYETNDMPVERACDECCGHGNEDGRCAPIVSWDDCGQDSELHTEEALDRPVGVDVRMPAPSGGA